MNFIRFLLVFIQLLRYVPYLFFPMTYLLAKHFFQQVSHYSLQIAKYIGLFSGLRVRAVVRIFKSGAVDSSKIFIYLSHYFLL